MELDIIKAFNESVFAEFKDMDLTEVQKERLLYLDSLKLILDKCFGCQYKTVYDESVGNFQIVPLDGDGVSEDEMQRAIGFIDDWMSI